MVVLVVAVAVDVVLVLAVVVVVVRAVTVVVMMVAISNGRFWGRCGKEHRNCTILRFHCHVLF